MTHPALLDCVETTTGPNPTRSVIWMHGLGADGHDFAPIVPALDLSGVPATRFVFPHSPVRAVTINNGMKMRAWYDIRVIDLVREEDLQGIRTSASQIASLIARENERGVATENIVLGGFSQGCAMALYTGLRHTERLAGILGLSGYLPDAASLTAERHDANLQTPVFLAHGTHDPVVPIKRAEQTRDALQAAGHAVEWHTYPMPHTVMPAELVDISAFLRRVLA